MSIILIVLEFFGVALAVSFGVLMAIYLETRWCRKDDALSSPKDYMRRHT